MTIDYRDAKLLWPALYKAVHEILGDAHVIIPIGDELVAGKVNASTFEGKAMGATAPADLTWTPSEAPSAFDSPVDLTDPSGWQGVVPVVRLNGTDEEADTPDDGFWTRSAAAFSVGVWVKADGAATNILLAKYDETTATPLREWQFVAIGGAPGLLIYDESNSARIGRKDSTTLTVGAWTHVVGTHSGGTTAATITVYINGVAADDADVNTGSGFAQMDGSTTKPTLGMNINSSGVQANFLDGSLAGGPLGPFFCQKELSATEVLDLYHIGAHALGLA